MPAPDLSPDLPRQPTSAELAVAASILFGEALWVLMQSDMHKGLFLSDLEWRVVPPIRLNQFRRYNVDGRPVGLLTWAKVSEAVSARLAAGGELRLKPEEWNSGEIVWVIDAVGPQGTKAMVRDFTEKSGLSPSLYTENNEKKTEEFRVMKS